MITLALEFSSSARSVAVLDLPPGAMDRARVLARVQEVAPRKSAPLELVERALVDARRHRAAVECIIVGLGPGSYTGIRSAIALTQGWQLARGVKTLGISTVEGLAWQAQQAGLAGLVHIASDAQRNEFYLADYRITDATRECVRPLRLATNAEMQHIIASGEPLVGPDLRRWFPDATNLQPAADAIGMLASGHEDFVSGEKLEPIYLRETTFVKAPPPRRCD